MGFFDGFAEGLSSAVDNIRNEFETAVYGRPTTDAIQLPDAPTAEPQQVESGVLDLTKTTVEDGWGVPPEWLADEPAVQPTSWAEMSSAMQDSGIEASQMDTPEVSAPSIEVGGDD